MAKKASHHSKHAEFLKANRAGVEEVRASCLSAFEALRRVLPTEASALMETIEQCMARLHSIAVGTLDLAEKYYGQIHKNPDNSNIPPSQAPNYSRPSRSSKKAQASKASNPSRTSEDAGPPEDAGPSGDSHAGDEPPPREQGGTDKPARRPSRHPGVQRQLLPPTEEKAILPGACPHCGGDEYEDLEEYLRFQCIELPKIPLDVIHTVVHKGRCRHCGSMVKGQLPRKEQQWGYGPRLTSLLGFLSAVMNLSTRKLRLFCKDALRLHISDGAIQKILHRYTEALTPCYHMLLRTNRRCKVGYFDETGWRQIGPNGAKRQYAWSFFTFVAGVFEITDDRSRGSFNELAGDWEGTAVTDDYVVYRFNNDAIELRQSCLAHHIRHAKGLTQSLDDTISKGGEVLCNEFHRLLDMRDNPPTEGAWRAWNARTKGCINKHLELQNDLGVYCRRLKDIFPSLYVFLQIPGVEPTNNRAERGLRPLVLRRRSLLGTNGPAGAFRESACASVVYTCALHDVSVLDLAYNALLKKMKGLKPSYLALSKAIRKKLNPKYPFELD